jgi:hypothetical protein
MGRAAAVHFFPGCKFGELGVEPTCPFWVLALSVRMKKAQNGYVGRQFNTSTRFIIWDEALWRGYPAKELEPTAAYNWG